MPLAHMTGSPRAALQSLAAKLTGVLGYFHSRDALEKVVYNQLTIARQTKARQVETYFRTIGSELRLLSTSQMVIDATREFRIAVDQLDRGGAPPELRRKVGDWYAANFVPQMKSVLGREPPLLNYLPVGGAPYYLQYHYIVENPNPPERRKLLDDVGDGSEYSKLHAIYHPDADRRYDGRLFRFHDRRPQIWSPDLLGPEGGRFHHLPPVRSPSPFQRRDRCRSLLGDRRPISYLS